MHLAGPRMQAGVFFCRWPAFGNGPEAGILRCAGKQLAAAKD